MIHTEVQFVRALSGREAKFRQTDDYVYNVRCRICGDSTKSQSKARGYFFRRGDSMLYFCHNCCDKAIPLPKYLKDYHPDLFEQFRQEKLREKFGDDYEDVKEKREQERIEEEKRREAIPKVLEKDPQLGIPFSKLPSDHPAKDYLRNRLIPVENFEFYYTENIHQIAKKINEKYASRKFPSGARIIIPHRTKEGYLLGVTARAIDGDASLRYIHLRVNEDAFFVYGLEWVDFSKNVFVVEGQFDAMFLSNAIAVGGSAMKKMRKMIAEWNLDQDGFTMVWDNDPRNNDVCKLIRASIQSGYHTVVWYDCPFVGSDINEMVLNGHTPVDIENWMWDHSRNSTDVDQLRLLANFNQWKRVSL